MNNLNNFFEKPPFSIDAQLEQLSSRGIVIQNREAAYRYLSYISYYRFCGYAIEFEEELIGGKKQYRYGTTFELILDCYIFDRQLRLLVIDAIERVEIAIRTIMINELALKQNDAHWYLDKTLFLPKYKHHDLIQSIKKETQYKAKYGTVQDKKRERFIKHYYDKYQAPELPAIWMVAGIITWVMVYNFC